ncbi:acriflavin resistance protein [Gemmatirosa kalamazoonensis]|uniref:Acriflavin resistance protein n=1 Tax=Gemmatirosa kalamazoonensis TaxID=861299 RepID=W0RC16_9BACT|nr:efflux RND transporter permease subunit [Gemmatirosa kalamazoonensis]AHG87992.1 acriflavin resistance protein [Gemmatirosa kalamazoonensis]
MFISDVSIRRPVFATMMMLTLVVLGVVAYQRLAIDEYPDITYPTVIVNTTYPGASPQTMERQVSRPIEEAVNTVQGMYEVSSTSLQGSSLVRLQFNLGVDIQAARQDVQAKVARIRRQLPPNIDEPIIQNFDPNDSPIVTLAVQSGERSLREITDLVDESVVTRLEAVPGVGAVNRSGGAARTIRVQLDPSAMRAYGISPPQVMQVLDRENQEIPAGRVDRGNVEQLVRITGRITDPKAFAAIPILVRNGVAVTIGDVATVVDGIADKRNASELDGKPAVSVDIVKLSGANTVAVADSVKAAVADLQRRLPSDVRIQLTKDDSKRIRDSLEDVEMSIGLGALLTIAIIYLFLNSWRSTVITGLALPISVISSFFGMWLFGFTLNTMTLLALSLAIGLLIDDAIVVRENIVRHMEMGKDHHQAASEGTSEIGLAVFSTTMAVIAVFIPVAFMGGMIGRIFFQFGVSVAFAVLVSLFVSFTLDPMLSSVWYDPDVEGGHASRRATRNPVRRFAFAFNDWFERVGDRYPRGLSWALRHRAIVMAGALVSVVIAFLIVPKLGFTWMPDLNGDDYSVSVRTQPGSTLEYTLERTRAVVREIKKDPDVEFTYLNVGGGFRGTPNNGNVNIKLKESTKRDRDLKDIQNDLRDRLRHVAGMRATIQGASSIFGGRGQPIRVNIQGPEITRLKIAAAQVLEAMRTIPGVAEPTSSDEGDIPQLDVQVDRQQAWAAGVSVGTIGQTLQPLFAGQRATRWEDPLGYEHDVIVVYPDSLRTTAANVADIPVPRSGTGTFTGTNATSGTTPVAGAPPGTIALAQVADIRAGVGPQQIERRQLERQITINSGVLPGYGLGDVADRVKSAIDSLGLPPGYHAVFTGDVQSLNETKGYVLSALLLAVVFIYLILASLFGSFLQPLAIMLALPLSFIGVTLALLLTNGNMNVMSMIGIIMLMGLVTKNGILLVDFTNQERAKGKARVEAILTASRERLRPIIMTTIAMIFGMIPLALAIGSGAEQRAPMARAVIGGLITSTILTLFVVPVMYTLLDDVGHAVLSRVRRAPTHVPAPEPVSGD